MLVRRYQRLQFWWFQGWQLCGLFVCLCKTINLVKCIFSYALKTKTDVTYIGSSFGYGAFAVVVIIVCCSVDRGKIVEIIVGLVIAGIFSFFLVYDL